jgi:two-component system, NtrC family, response regulator HydG
MPTILVVDDDPDTCRNMADIFGDRGYRVDAANGGDSALEQARRQPYDVGLLDLRMPGMDGLTLCRRLKHQRPGMVNLLVTGYPGDGLDEEAHAAGASQVLHKPVDLGKLFALVEQAVASTN